MKPVRRALQVPLFARRSHQAHRPLSLALGIAALSATGCGPVHRIEPPAPGPTAQSPAQPVAPASTAAAVRPATVPTHESDRGRSWSFAYAPGVFTYDVVISGTVAPAADTSAKRPLPERTQRATLSIAEDGDVKVTEPVVASTEACDPASAIATFASSLIPKLPPRLTVGDAWTDSTTTSGCRGTVPTTTHALHNYTVVGDTTIAGAPAVIVHRIDSIAADGEGPQGQHRVFISATGTGTADILLDPSAGRFIGLNGTQSTTVDVTTSGRSTRFLQLTNERVTSTP